MSQTPALVINGLPLLNPFVGIGVYTSHLVAGLIKRRDELPFVVLLPETAGEVAASWPEGIAVFVKGASPKHALLNNVYWNHRIAKQAATCYPDAVFHCPGPFWSLYRPQRTIVTLHDCIAHHFPRYLGKFFIRRFLARLSERYAAKAARILTVSEFSAREIAGMLGVPRQKIEVIHNHVEPRYLEMDREAEKRRIREKFSLPFSYWLYVGGYDYRKNIDFLIRAYATARKTQVLPPLVLAGEIPTDLSKPYCDVRGALADAQLPAKSVWMPGRISSEDLPGFYAAANLLVYPSLYEGFGLPPAEAMAVGTPVLVSNTSSLPEVVLRPECRFDPTKIGDLADKLIHAAQRPTDFYCRMPEEFTEQVAISRYIETIRRLSAA